MLHLLEDVVVGPKEQRMAPEALDAAADEPVRKTTPAKTAPTASTASGTSMTSGDSCAAWSPWP